MPAQTDPAETYWVVRRAVRDAVWDVLGTVLLLVLAWALFVVGAGAVVSATADLAGLRQVVLSAFGVVLMAGAVVVTLRELGVFPFDRR